MYFPALPNCMSIFHSFTGGSITTSLTLHDLVIWVFSGTEQNISVERQAFASFKTWLPQV